MSSSTVFLSALMTVVATATLGCSPLDRGFTVTLREQSLNADGAPAAVRERVVAFRPDGSRAEQRTFFGDETGAIRGRSRRVVDREPGIDVGIHPETQTKITGPIRDPQPAPPTCTDVRGPLRESSEVSETILGYRVVKLSDRKSMQDGAVSRIQEWRAPDLGCVALRSENSSRLASGEFLGRTKTEVVSIDIGAPDPALFAIPEDYAEQAHLFEEARAKTFSWRRGQE